MRAETLTKPVLWTCEQVLEAAASQLNLFPPCLQKHTATVNSQNGLVG